MNVAYAAAFLVLTFAFTLIFIVYLKHFDEISDESYHEKVDENGLSQPMTQSDIA